VRCPDEGFAMMKVRRSVDYPAHLIYKTFFAKRWQLGVSIQLVVANAIKEYHAQETVRDMKPANAPKSTVHERQPARTK
jgi:hypothetical protein